LRAIFVSYRRSDSQGEAGRLFDDLVKHFGDDMVFMDVAGIEAGRDFRKVIEESVAECGVLLVMIGPGWLNAKDERGVRRLDDSGDFVRIETASALRRDVPVVPILVRGAAMPHAEQLPEDLKELAFRNCCELTHARWKSDVQLLLDALHRLVGEVGQSAAKTGRDQAAPASSTNSLKQKITGTAKSESLAPIKIDPAILQRVSRELALHIGPIAEIVVRHVAASCASVDDLYLKVAEEIESPAERERFLSARDLLSATALSEAERPTSRSANGSAALPSPTVSQFTNERLRPTMAPAGERSSGQRKFSPAVAGAGALLVLLIVLGTYFVPRKENSSLQTAQTSGRDRHTSESATVNPNATPPGSSTVSNGIPGGVATSSVRRDIGFAQGSKQPRSQLNNPGSNPDLAQQLECLSQADLHAIERRSQVRNFILSS
jgi:TIR domain